MFGADWLHQIIISGHLRQDLCHNLFNFLKELPVMLASQIYGGGFKRKPKKVSLF